MFNKHKKRDDLADSFLQALWFLGQNDDNTKKIISKVQISNI